LEKIYLLTFCLSILITNNKTWAQCPKPQTDFSSCKFTPIGHRGYPSEYPENTLLSLEELFKRGVKYAEVDVSLTLDSVYILFHDYPTIFRTTNGSGNLSNKTYAELQQLDVGSWKGEQFKNQRIGTLVEALKLAEKYDAHLYLDTKDYDVAKLKAALDAADASPKRFMPSITYINDAIEFRKDFPNTPWVWFGGGYYPDEINNDSFYLQCKQLGCLAFEINSIYPGDSLWNTFKTKVHNNGMQIWAFTENDNTELSRLVKLGVDGIETDRAWEAARFICNGIKGVPFQDETIANYIFEGNFNAKHIGSQIRLLNYQSTPTAKIPEFAPCSFWGIPFIEDQDKTVMKVHSFDSTNGLLVYNNSRDENYGILDDSYTLIMDVYIPKASMGKYIALLQTSNDNINDADIFINPEGGIGTSDVYDGYVSPNVWNRIAIVYDGKNNVIKKYINGIYLGKNIVEGSRWAIWNSSKPGDKQGFLLFADNDGETAEIYVSAVQLRNFAATDSLIGSLGMPQKNGIKMGSTKIWDVNLSTAYSDSTILDYENKTYYFVIPTNNKIDSALLTYKLADNAVSSISLSKYIHLSTPFEFTVTSEDGNKQVKWKICIRKAGAKSRLKEKTHLLPTKILH
jgi:glycerophosphoryl diester phosphodiesterase